MNALTRNGLRIAVLASIAAATSFLSEPGIALATARDDPTGTVTDAVDDTTDPITDAVDDTTDPITDAVDDTTDPITDAVDDTTDPITDTVDDTADPITDTVDGASGTVTDAVDDGTDDVARDTVGGSELTSRASTTSRGYEGSPGIRASATRSSDLDELAQGGNDIVEGSGGAVCVGTAHVVCRYLVGGLGVFGLLFGGAEEARDVVSSFTDALASTGIDLLGAAVVFVTLTVTGIMLISMRRRPGRARARGRRSAVRM